MPVYMHRQNFQRQAAKIEVYKGKRGRAKCTGKLLNRSAQTTKKTGDNEKPDKLGG